jgi:hypothetical protein
MPQHTLTDELNDAGISVEVEGRCLKLGLLNFEGNPLIANLSVPRGSSKQAIRKFFHMLRANEDVYLALLTEFEAATAEPKAAKPATGMKAKAKTGRIAREV